MKKLLLFCLISFLGNQFLNAQTTEDFEGDTTSATNFTDNGQNFTITNGAGETNYDIEFFSNGGWNGTTTDHKFVDNSGTPAPTLNNGSSFTITTTDGTDIYINNLYVFLSQFNLNAASGFTLTIEGRVNGGPAYTIVKSTGFSNTTTFTPNNGFTFIDFTTEGGSDNSNTAIDELIFTSTVNADYLALDGMNWEPAALGIEENLLTNETSLYPNPNKGDFTLNYSGNEQLKELQVLDMLGKRIQTISLENFANSKEINLTTLAKGMYFITIQSETTSVTKRMIIE